MQRDELRSLFLFEGLTDAQLDELLAVADEVGFDEGIELFSEGQPADSLWVLLEGQLKLVRRAGREEPVVLRTMDRPGLWAGGFRAWDANGTYLATGYTASPGRALRLPADELGRLGRAWFPFGVHLIEGFFQTVRTMDSLSRQRESLIALGGLAAGLAHELNNPASATARAVDALRDNGRMLLGSLTQLAERSLLASQFVALDALRLELDTTPTLHDAVAMADREDALLTWLEGHGVANAWRLAPALAMAGADTDWCQRVSDVLEPQHYEAGFEWVASAVSAQTLLAEIKESTTRISTLVDAIKSYSQVDRATQQEIDVTDGLESTLVMIKHRLGHGVTVKRDYGVDVPRVVAHPGELNQVWTNLIVNAADAVDGNGVITISTRDEPDWVAVSIADTGPGMPPDVQARAFEPFFTTKDVGKGTGLGLDVSRRIVADRHKGTIAIESDPGNTVITVRLPKR